MPTIRIIVKPGSRVEGVSRNTDGSLTVRVRARAVDGKANERMVEVLSEYLQCKKSSIALRTGHTARIKLVEVPHAPLRSA